MNERPVRYNFSRDHKPGEYIGFEIRVCFSPVARYGGGLVSNVDSGAELRFHQEKKTDLFWGVYCVDSEGMSSHLGDFTSEQDALDTVEKLGGKLSSSR